MIGEGVYRSLLVLSLDEEGILWQTVDEALEASRREPQRACEIAIFVWEESRGRSADLSRAAVELLTAIWGVEVRIVHRG